MNWTKDTPTQEGYYWVSFGRGYRYIEVVLLVRGVDDTLHVHPCQPTGNTKDTNVVIDWWMGPLVIPEWPTMKPPMLEDEG